MRRWPGAFEQRDDMNPEVEAESRKLRQATAEARAVLGDAAEKLRALLQDDAILPETPLEAQAAMEFAVEAIGLSVGAH